tara:strand:+ start:351 stop:1094 length:744 start_codon:yes stop_codon:yes gene_type:complete
MSEKKSKFKKTDATISINPMQDDLKKIAGLGAAATGLSAAGKKAVKDIVKSRLVETKQFIGMGKRGDFGSPKASKRIAKSLSAGRYETASKPRSLHGEELAKKHSPKAMDEARKFFKKKKIKYDKQGELLRKFGKKEGGIINKETKEMIESFQNDRTPKFDRRMYDQPESMGGDKKPKAVRPKAQPNQKREGEKPIAKPGKKPIAKRLPDKPVTKILEKKSIEFIGKNKKSKGGLIKGFPRLAKKGF